MYKTEYNIKAYIQNQVSESVETFDTLKEAQEALAAITAEDCLDSYYEDLVKVGGDLTIEDSYGNVY